MKNELQSSRSDTDTVHCPLSTERTSAARPYSAKGTTMNDIYLTAKAETVRRAVTATASRILTDKLIFSFSGTS